MVGVGLEGRSWKVYDGAPGSTYDAVGHPINVMELAFLWFQPVGLQLACWPSDAGGMTTGVTWEVGGGRKIRDRTRPKKQKAVCKMSVRTKPETSWIWGHMRDRGGD